MISYDNPCTPKFVLRDDLRAMERIEPPKDFQMRMTQEQTPGQKKRQELISELLEEESYVWDRTGRNTKIREIAARENTSERRIRELYFRALAGRALVEERKKAEKEETKEEKDFLWQSTRSTIQRRSFPCGVRMICFCFPDTRIQTDIY